MARISPAIIKRNPGRSLLVSILALILIVITIGEVIGWPFLRGPVQNFMSTRLERSVKIEQPFQVKFIGGIRLKAGNFWMSAPQGFDAPYLIDAKDIKLHLRYGDLLDINNDPTLPVRIKTLQVGEAEAFFIRHADGKSTWAFDKDPNEPSRPFPAIENLVVENGVAHFNDALTESNLKVGFITHEGSDKDIEATSKVTAKGKFREIGLDAELTTAGFLPIAAMSKVSGPAKSKGWVNYGGVRVDFDGSVSDIFGEKNIKGKFSVKGPSLSTFGLLVSTLLPTTSPFTLQGDIEKSDNVWSADIKSAKIGKSDLSGQFKYDPRPEIPMFTGTLKATRFYLSDLAPAFGADTGNASKDAKSDAPDRIFPDRPLNLPSLNTMNALVIIDMDYVELGKAFDKPIAPLKAELDLNKGKLSLAKVSAKTADGSISGVISVDAHQTVKRESDKKNQKPSELPDWGIDLQWKNINLEKWLTVSKDRKQNAAKEGKEVPPAYITGTLNGKTKLAGKGNSTAELLGSLNGDVSLYIQNGSLSHLVIEALGLDLAQALGVMIRGDQSLPMQCAVVDLKSKKGIVTPNVAMIDTPVTLILADGSIDLEKERLDLRMLAKPKNVSPFTVRSPILVKGTFLNPDVSLEAGPIAARAVGAIALAFVNPLAAILPFLDPGSGDQEASCKDALAELKNSDGKSPAKPLAKKQAEPVKTPVGEPEGRIPGM